jgi:hypothetical protein
LTTFSIQRINHQHTFVFPGSKEVIPVHPEIIATPEMVESYFRLFVNRKAYTVQSFKPHPETGRHCYFRPTNKATKAALILTVDTIRNHLEGEITIGLYAINPESQRSKWLAIDADYKNAMEHLLKPQYHLGQEEVQAALEMSRRGGHLWIFLESPLLAKECRVYIYNLALRLNVPVKGYRVDGVGLRDGIEIFPKHDEIGAKGFGNAIRGPLGIHRGANQRYWFYGADYTLAAQMGYLSRLDKVSETQLRSAIAGMEMPPGARQPEPPAPSLRTFSPKRAPRREFRILDYSAQLGRLGKAGRNYVGRCPSCAQAGHDRGGDNLAICISDSRFYQCWAGCSKEVIREALGQPCFHGQRSSTKINPGNH